MPLKIMGHKQVWGTGMDKALEKVVGVDWEEAFTKAKAIHAEAMGKRLNNASTTHICEDGTVGYTREGNVCHNHMNNNGFKYVVNGLQIGTDYTRTKGRCLPKEVELWFVDYILNRSPYSETFVSKDAVVCLQEQMTISSGDHPANLMVAGLVALRRLWEYTTVVSVAYSLAKLGVNEDLAFVLGHLAQVEEVPNEHSLLSWTGCKSSHCSIDPEVMGFKALKNFLSHQVVEKNGRWSAGARYQGYDGMYCPGGVYEGANIYKYVEGGFPHHLCRGGTTGVSDNPFTASLPKVVGAALSGPYSKAIEVMAEWANTHLMEKIKNA